MESIVLYREHPTFQSYAVPQIQVTMKLNCDTIEQTKTIENETFNPNPFGNYSRDISLNFEDGRWYVLANDIDYAPDITVLTVIIKDINNNEPIIHDPSDGSYIGYPAAELAQQILPEHLIKVYATDRDADLNAKIRYTLAEQSHFKIMPETGVIYPTRTAMLSSNSVILEITATDRDGAEDGLKSSISLHVFKLEAQHLTIVTVQVDGGAVQVEDVLELIRAKGALNLMVLQHAFVSFPGKNSEATIRPKSHLWTKQVPLDSLRLIVYAFSDRNELITTAEVQR